MKSARRIEVLVIAALICVLLLMQMDHVDAQPSGTSEEEMRMQHILSQVDGAGHVSVMLTEEGAVVTAEGADDIRVVLGLQRAVRTLTGLELSQIEILKSEG